MPTRVIPQTIWKRRQSKTPLLCYHLFFLYSILFFFYLSLLRILSCAFSLSPHPYSQHVPYILSFQFTRKHHFTTFLDANSRDLVNFIMSDSEDILEHPEHKSQLALYKRIIDDLVSTQISWWRDIILEVKRSVSLSYKNQLNTNIATNRNKLMGAWRMSTRNCQKLKIQMKASL